MREVRRWKRLLDKEEPTYPARVDLSVPQKGVLLQAWMWFAQREWGWDGKTVPCAIPRYNERKGFFHVPAIAPNVHHVKNVGEVIRLEGLNEHDYNRPENLAPVSKRLHVGAGVRLDDEDEFMVIHEDTMDALRGYSKWAEGGKVGKNPMQAMHDIRKEHTDRGELYHNDIHDDYLAALAARVWTTFTILTGVMWPERRRRK